jgi:hypothetical protein
MSFPERVILQTWDWCIWVKKHSNSEKSVETKLLTKFSSVSQSSAMARKNNDTHLTRTTHWTAAIRDNNIEVQVSVCIAVLNLHCDMLPRPDLMAGRGDEFTP